MQSIFTYLMSASSKSDSNNFATVVNNSPTTPVYLKPGVTYTGGVIDSACISVVAESNTVVNVSGMTKSNNGAVILRGGTYSAMSFPGNTADGGVFYLELHDVYVPGVIYAARNTEGTKSYIKIVTLISGCTANGMVCGVYAKNSYENDTESVTANISGSSIVILYAGGYMLGNDVVSDAVQMSVANVTLNLDDGTVISDEVYGGIHTRYYGNARVDNVTINVSGGDYNTIFGGGWAQTGGTSYVDNVVITVSGGSIETLYAGGNNAATGSGYAHARARVNTSGITITNGSVETIYLSSKYITSAMTGSVTLTVFGGEITNIFGCAYDNTLNGKREVIIAESCTIGTINTVDVITIHGNKTLTVTTSAELNKINLAIDSVTLPWVILSGADLSGITSVVFAVNDQEVAVTWNADNTVGVLGDTGYTLNVSGNVLTLTQA